MTYTAAEMRDKSEQMEAMAKAMRAANSRKPGVIADYETAAAMLRQAADAMDGGVWISHEMNDFLHGAAQFDGTWFGERHREKKGAFWWRRLLPDSKASAALSTTPPAKD